MPECPTQKARANLSGVPRVVRGGGALLFAFLLEVSLPMRLAHAVML
mgnify:CR=1 FL=1